MSLPLRLAPLVCLLFLRAVTALGAWPNADQTAKLTSVELEPVWSGHPVGFALSTRGDQQFAAYYDANRQMSVAQRTLGQSTWKITKLDCYLGWDTHNAVVLALDRAGCLHVSGNMHGEPLIYFRSTEPLDPSTLVKVSSMVGRQEDRCTYPAFYHTPDNALVFAYREGKSGLGDNYFNLYDEKTKTWSRLMDRPIFDGLGRMNSYPISPELRPDGYYHLTWVWRDTPMAETNHDLSYARSKNLRDWETVDGKPITLPITVETPGVVVDPVPTEGGILNGAGAVGFDLEKRLVISYHKFDAAGNTQAYFARFEDGAWKHYQASDWHYRWDPRGGGSIVQEVSVGGLRESAGHLRVAIKHPTEGSGDWEVDPKTLRLTQRAPAEKGEIPAALQKVTGTFPGLSVRWAGEHDSPDPAASHYRLRWETLEPNRDQPRPKPWPEPSMLKLIVLP